MAETAMHSVVLPNYNHAAYIGRALAALLAQERPADEIIVIDDASSDDSLRVIGEFAKAPPSIRVLVNPKNVGVMGQHRRPGSVGHQAAFFSPPP